VSGIEIRIQIADKLLDYPDQAEQVAADIARKEVREACRRHRAEMINIYADALEEME
jgi:hypothetical protein